MDADQALAQLMLAIDERRWEDLRTALHPDFRCHYVHTGEELDADAWIRLNAEYPGFDRLQVQETVGGVESAACRSLITGHDPQGSPLSFGCATFVQMRDGAVVLMTEVWTDIGQAVPEGTRPAQ